MHTPGPWKIEDGEPNSQIVYIVESDGESTIGEIDLSGDGIDEEIGQANARLIASAPDMLEALRAAQDAKGDWRALVDAAIAQATT
jgi:hypothetical protein